MFENLRAIQRMYDEEIPDDDRSDEQIEADAEAAATERRLKAERDELLKRSANK